MIKRLAGWILRSEIEQMNLLRLNYLNRILYLEELKVHDATIFESDEERRKDFLRILVNREERHEEAS